MDYERIALAYKEILGPLNAIKAQIIDMALDHGLTVDAILDAIEQTAMARRPSHPYFKAVLTRYMNDGLRTKAQLDADRQSRRRERFISNRERWSEWYERPEDMLPW